MIRVSIEDYLYFFWAPLLKAGTLPADRLEAFEQMIILTLSQASVFIEAPTFKPGASRDFPPDITRAITVLTDKILAAIPGRARDDSYWLKIAEDNLIPAGPGFTDTHLEPEQSFGPFRIAEDKFLTFDFYYLAHQLRLRLPQTAGVSAVISTKKPLVVPDGPVANLDIPSCSIWLSVPQISAAAADINLFTSLRLKACTIEFDNGFTKLGDLVSAGLFTPRAGFVMTCLTEDETIGVDPGFTVAGRNKLVYPEKIVFTVRTQPQLMQPEKIILTSAEAFTSNLFGSALTTLPLAETRGTWLADQSQLSFPLITDTDDFAATTIESAVFDLKGAGKMANAAWYFPVVTNNHPLAFARLGIASESGYLGFNLKEDFTLSWSRLQNAAIKIKELFIRASPEKLFINYTSQPSVLAHQQLQLWRGNGNRTGRSSIDLSYKTGGTGRFFSHRKTNEHHITSAAIDVDIDRPLLSDGDRVFLQTAAGLMFINDTTGVTAVVIGEKMSPALAFENVGYKPLASFALSNALVLVNPVESFILIGVLNAEGIAATGQCMITFPVPNIEHTLPDPYITNLFDDQRRPNNDGQPPTQGLKATVRWNDTDDAELVLQLSDLRGNVFKPTPTLTDEQMAERLLHFPLPHPAEPTYNSNLSAAIGLGGTMTANTHLDATPYSGYQSFYHSSNNTMGAFATLHILPGNAFLVDVSGRASQMGVAFSTRLGNVENGILSVLDNTGYTPTQTFRIENNEVVSSGRFVRAFTLPHVQWEPVFFEHRGDLVPFFSQENPFSTHGVPTRISSANKADVPLAPIPVTKYIVDGFGDEKRKFAAAAHFALPFGMNAVALFHPMVDNVVLPPIIDLPFGVVVERTPDPYSYSTLHFNQPAFTLKNGSLSGAIQVKVSSEGLPKIPRDNFPDPSFHGAVLQMVERFDLGNVDVRLQRVIAGTQSASAVLPQFIIGAENAGFVLLKNTVIIAGAAQTLIDYKSDSILGIPITGQFNKQMWGEQVIQTIQVDKVNKRALVSSDFKRSANAKVPLRRIDFSGLGASIFSNWLNKSATAGAVSQVKFNILIGRVTHEVIQIKSTIIPWFIPVVRTLIIERKNHGSIIRTDSGWVATGPGEFHVGYRCHPGVVRGMYNVTSIKDTQINIKQPVSGGMADMAGVYFDADVRVENVVSGFKNTLESPTGNYKLVPSKKQFGYIILGNPNDGVKLQDYFTDINFRDFMSRPDVGALGGPVDCVVNIAGSDQMMHLTRVDVTATTSTAFVAAARGTLHLPKGGSWSVVKKVTNGATLPLTNDETVPLIRNGVLQFNAAGNPVSVTFNNSLHVLGNPLEIEKYAAGLSALAGTEFALLQSTDTQKLLFPRPSFDSKADAVINNGITDGMKKIFTTNPTIADPYSLLKSNTIFPDHSDALTLGNVQGLVKSLDTIRDKAGISFPADVADALKSFTPLECLAVHRKLQLVKQGSFEIYLDYGDDSPKNPRQKFSISLDGDADDHAADAAPKKWQMLNTDVAIVVNLDVFQPLIIVRGNFDATAGKKPEFKDARIEWGGEPALQKIVEVLTILYQFSTMGSGGDVIKDGFKFAMGNAPDSWSYKCTIEEKIPVIKFPTPVQLSQLPGPAPLILEAGLNLGVFFNLSLSPDPKNLIKAGAGVVLGFEATIQVLILTIEVATAYGVGSARVDIFIELPDAEPRFKFTMGFGATVAVQLPVVGYVSITRVISLGASIDSNHLEMTVGQMLRGVITIAGGLASVCIQVEASGTVTDTAGDRSAIVRGVFSLDITVAWVVSWDFSKEFEHTIDLPNPF